MHLSADCSPSRIKKEDQPILTNIKGGHVKGNIVPHLDIKKEKNKKSPRKNKQKQEMLTSNMATQEYNDIISGELPSNRKQLTPPRDVSPNIRRQNKMFNDDDYDPVTKKQRNKDLKK